MASFPKTGPRGLEGPVGPAGSQGSQGSVGPEGPQGPDGEGTVGAEGPQGTAGPQGNLGPAGPQGNTGPEGPKGATGAQGVKGETGLVGTEGVKGPKGDTGAEGPKGTTGSQGEKGAAGAEGPQGVKGETGAKGAEGSQGTQGVKGETGAKGAEGSQGTQGVKGETGPTGSAGQSFTWKGNWSVATTYNLDDAVMGSDGSAYIAIKGGNIGHDPTLELPEAPIWWSLSTIHGAVGPKGEKGATGSEGPQGVKGEKGATGPEPTTMPESGVVGLTADLDIARRQGLREKMWWACSDPIFNPALATAAPVSRVLSGARFAPSRNVVVKGIAIRVGAVASKNDEGAVMLYDSTGATLLAKSGAVAGKLNVLGMQTFSFETPFECKVGSIYYPCFQYGTVLETAATLARIEGANQIATQFGSAYGERLIVQPATPATFPYTGALAAAGGSVSYACWVIES